MDAETFELKGQWEKDRGPQQLAYDFWWHLGHDAMITTEWGTPNMVKDGVNPELLLAGKYGHKLHVWDLDKRTPPAGARPGPGAADGARAAARARSEQGVRVRRRGALAQGSVFVDLDVASRGRRNGKNGEWAVQKVIEIPAEPADPALCRRCSRASRRCRRW